MAVGGAGATQEYIITALLQLLHKKAFSQISVTELCRKAGVSRMSFYRYFESREDVLKKWCAQITDKFVAESGIHYRTDTLKQYFTTLFTHVLQYREMSFILRKNGLLWIVKDDIDRVFFETYRGVYDEYKMSFITGGIFNAYTLWIENGLRETPEELAFQLSEILEK
ncbi:MAG: TetR/AcrR family transcriptional regulator [Lachnospiraceae bacterium]|nr:TetR/AcrR family transcriptional regulator [Lachnospiraceae bacterium]